MSNNELKAIAIGALVIVLALFMVALQGTHLQSECIKAKGSWDPEKGCQIK